MQQQPAPGPAQRPISPAPAALLLVLAACTQPSSRPAPPPAAPAPAVAPSTTAPSPVVGAAAVAPPRVLSRRTGQGPVRFLVVLLHGYGGTAEDLLQVAEPWARALPDAEVLLPDGFDPFEHGGPGRQWYSLADDPEVRREERLRPAARALSTWIDGELDRRQLTRDRVFVAGFSQGAILSQWLAVFRSPTPLGAVSFAGLLAVDEPVEASRTRAPVLLVHGTHDTRIPAARAEEARTGLSARGASVELFLRPGLGHAVDAASAERGLAFLRAHLPR